MSGPGYNRLFDEKKKEFHPAIAQKNKERIKQLEKEKTEFIEKKKVLQQPVVLDFKNQLPLAPKVLKTLVATMLQLLPSHDVEEKAIIATRDNACKFHLNWNITQKLGEQAVWTHVAAPYQTQFTEWVTSCIRQCDEKMSALDVRIAALQNNGVPVAAPQVSLMLVKLDR